MQPVYLAALRSWSIPPAATFALVLTALVYLRGWWLLRRAGSPAIPVWRAVSFVGGLLTLFIALASPVDVFNSFLVTAHMLQHMLLMMVAPPLILLGSPLIPLVRGLPVFAAREFAGPFLNWPLAGRMGLTLTHPVCALILMGSVMFAWHTPALYELALRSSAWHQTEHACFFLTSLVFWWPVIQPWPSRAQWPRWAMVPYLVIADLQNTILSAILVFSDRVLYPSYFRAPRLFGLSAMEDQAAAGSIMWVLGSVAFLIPAVIIAVQCLSKKSAAQDVAPTRKRDVSPPEASLLTSERTPSIAREAPSERRGSRREAAVSLTFFVVSGLCFAGLLDLGARDDNDQALLFQGTSGPFAVTVFGPPDEIDAGTISFDVLVQDRTSGSVVLDAPVELAARPANVDGPSLAAIQATHEESNNKLLQQFEITIQDAGDFNLLIDVGAEGGTAFSMPIRMVKPDRHIAFPWGSAGLLVLAALLLIAYLYRHRAPSRVQLENQVSRP
ncbi:MAG: cytochrome c oxidase assembly protein [Acidobacteriota bacterium]|nr:cytochrome c oxidase assembly protein [Acidobacteriota bacterium]